MLGMEYIRHPKIIRVLKMIPYKTLTNTHTLFLIKVFNVLWLTDIFSTLWGVTVSPFWTEYTPTGRFLQWEGFSSKK